MAEWLTRDADVRVTPICRGSRTAGRPGGGRGIELGVLGGLGPWIWGRKDRPRHACRVGVFIERGKRPYHIGQGDAPRHFQLGWLSLAGIDGHSPHGDLGDDR